MSRPRCPTFVVVAQLGDREYFVDETRGSWRHELDPRNRPSSHVWEGKPDVYHAYQAMLLPRLGEVSSFVDGAVRLAPERA